MSRVPCIWTALVAALLLAHLANGRPVQSPARPELSGTWLLDQKKSSGAGLTRRPDLPLKISYHDPEFRIALSSEADGKIVERVLVYFTDGRGETNPAITGLTTNPSVKPDELKGQTTKSTTRWSRDKIVIRSILRLNAGGHIVEFEQIDEWKLSVDSKSLIQTTRTVPVTGGPIFVMAADKKRVYNRV